MELLTFNQLKQKALSLPLLPGVYIMREQSGGIIYIGKAKRLKNRVSGYFNQHASHDEKTRKMVANVSNFDTVVTDSEYEALILECSLIKQHKPKYNILLKDDKGYSYIRISPPPFPKITAERQTASDGARYLGPYYSSFMVTQTVDEVLKLFRLPQCKRELAKGTRRERPCLNYFLKQCCAPCGGKISAADYESLVADAVAYLQTGAEQSAADLTARMEAAAEALEFEKAARLRDRVNAIKKMSQKQKVILSKIRQQDVIALAQSAAKLCFEVFRFEDGRLVDREHFMLERQEDLPAARTGFLTQYYGVRQKIPSRIALCGPVEDEDLLARWLGEQAGKTVRLTHPRKGEQADLLRMCQNNAAEHLAQTLGQTGRQTKALDDLARLLGLAAPPARIEAYDISHTAGSENVGGMVVFEQGLPKKSDYRRFKIKGFSGQDDCASLREVLNRRLDEYKAHKGEAAGFGALPNLLLIDGGTGQLNAVLEILQSRGLTIPAFGMVKDSRHRTRAIAATGGEISLAATRSSFSLVTKIQDEVHRFAIAYHHTRQKNTALASRLTGIPGVGPATAKALLGAFKTLKAIGNASVEELAAVKGVSKTAAQNIAAAFQQNE